jgi:hypothetical protein
MPELTREDLQYKYEWTASNGDNPKLIHEDASHLSRKEGYEMILFLNKLGMSSDKTEFVYGDGGDLKVEARLQIEWMLKEHFESTSPGRGTVFKWINDNWDPLRGNFKAFEKKK